MSEFLKSKPLGVVGNTMDTKENVSIVTKSLMQPTIDKVQDATKDFVVNNIPEKLHTTLGLSYTLVKGAIDKGYDFNIGESGKLSLDWKDKISIKYNLKF
tara:strand:- start:410 stop:709 length:300 start_codon:yes stop_codon:yes gene_type:complete